MRYPIVLLDLDHTLFDSDTSEERAFDATLRAAGVESPRRYAERYQAINLALWSDVERGVLRPQRVRNLRFERLVEEFGFDADPARLADDFVTGMAAYGELYDGTAEVLEALAGRCRLGLITNGLAEVQRPRIERLGIDGLFDAVVISAEVGVAKPHAAIFDIAFERLGSPPRENAVMVGDNLGSDIRGGSDYGIATCWFNPSRRSAGNGHRIDHEISALGELLAL